MRLNPVSFQQSFPQGPSRPSFERNQMPSAALPLSSQPRFAGLRKDPRKDADNLISVLMTVLQCQPGTEASVTLGRSSKNTVVLNDSGISRNHLVFYQSSTGNIRVQDLGTTRGSVLYRFSDQNLFPTEVVVLNGPLDAKGKRYEAGIPRRLKNGDVISIAGYLFPVSGIKTLKSREQVKALPHLPPSGQPEMELRALQRKLDGIDKLTNKELLPQDLAFLKLLKDRKFLTQLEEKLQKVHFYSPVEAATYANKVHLYATTVYNFSIERLKQDAEVIIPPAKAGQEVVAEPSVIQAQQESVANRHDPTTIAPKKEIS